MRAEFAAERLRCPVCGCNRTLRLHARESDPREVREGLLRCLACSAELPVRRGVGHLMPDPPAHVAREAAGLERFAEFMHNQGWDRDRVRQLPNFPDGYWYVQARSMIQLLDTVEFRAGQWILDVGSNTCWASNHFAVRGLQVIALDISTTELQGLYTSDYFIEDGTSYFERVLASMNRMPMADDSLDYVYCCEVLHHNDLAGLRQTFEEAFRVLRPGGKLLVVNETLKTIRDPVGVHLEGVAEFDGYEHAHWASRYRWEALRAGFATKLLEPSYHEFFGPGLPKHQPSKWTPVKRAVYELQSRRLVRRGYLEWVNDVAGGVSFGMIATKPLKRPKLRPRRPARPALRGPRPRAARSG
jgi:SAM-dependent methyltransferase